MISNAYTLLIIYARVDLTPIYIVCLSCLLVVEEVIRQFKMKLESSQAKGKLGKNTKVLQGKKGCTVRYNPKEGGGPTDNTNGTQRSEGA